jgi:hypothetical protein
LWWLVQLLFTRVECVLNLLRAILPSPAAPIELVRDSISIARQRITFLSKLQCLELGSL